MRKSNHPHASTRGHRWLRRAAIALLCIAVGFELVYVVAANIILRTHALDRWITGATEGLFLRVDSGWTLWPGYVHVKGLEFHFEDYNMQFEVALDRADVDLMLWQM